MKKEQLQWDVDHTSILSHLIESQNGTVSSAINELIMNVLDKNSTKCEITLTTTSFKVLDNGIGFADREDITKHFQCFGKKHTLGDATFGRFRIGRGQIIALSKACWKSNHFEMRTDHKSNPTGFDLITVDEYKEGCEVTGDFYTPLDNYQVTMTVREISNFCRYINIPVIINGTIINDDISERNWDYEDDLICINFNNKRLSDGIFIYNLGVFVQEIPPYHFGLTCDVITKQSMSINMARNEIQDQDPIWEHIQKTIRQISHKKTQKNKNTKLNKSQRIALVSQLRAGLLNEYEALSLPLISDTRGCSFSIRKLAARKYPVTVSSNNELADRINSSRAATVLSEEELDLWQVNSIEELKSVFIEITETAAWEYEQNNLQYLIKSIQDIRVADFAKLSMGLSTTKKHLRNTELSKREQAARNAIQYAANNMAKRLSKFKSEEVLKRKIIVGLSDTAHAWTDGETYIAINRNALDFLDAGEYGSVQITLLLLHEYTHDESDLSTHQHSMSFYEQYHDYTLAMSKQDEIVGHVSSSLKSKYIDEITKKLLPESPGAKINKNWLSKYTFTLDKKNHLSELAKDLLSMIREKGWIAYSKSKNQFTLTTPANKNHEVKPLDKLFCLARNDGYEIPEFDYTIYGGFDQYINAIMPIVKTWADEKQHCMNGIKALLNSKMRYGSLSDFAIFAVNDSQSGFVSVKEHKTLFCNEEIITKKLINNISSPNISIGNRYSDSYSEAELSKSKTKRLEFAVNLIKDSIKTLQDKAEREEVLTLLQSESFQSSMRSN